MDQQIDGDKSNCEATLIVLEDVRVGGEQESKQDAPSNVRDTNDPSLRPSR